MYDLPSGRRPKASSGRGTSADDAGTARAPRVPLGIRSTLLPNRLAPSNATTPLPPRPEDVAPIPWGDRATAMEPEQDELLRSLNIFYHLSDQPHEPRQRPSTPLAALDPSSPPPAPTPPLAFFTA
jgi:hypothetical protein